MTTAKKFRVVQYIDGHWIVDYVHPSDFPAWCNIHGLEITGQNFNPKQRAELQGAPRVSGLLGPMWDGDAIRYENQSAYDVLST